MAELLSLQPRGGARWENPPSLASLVRFAFVRGRGWCCILLRSLHASIRERRYGWSGHDRETLSRWWPFALPLVGSPWLGESVRYRLGPSDLVFDANGCQCLSTCVGLELGTVRFSYLGRPERCMKHETDIDNFIWNSFKLIFYIV